MTQQASTTPTYIALTAGVVEGDGIRPMSLSASLPLHFTILDRSMVGANIVRHLGGGGGGGTSLASYPHGNEKGRGC